MKSNRLYLGLAAAVIATVLVAAALSYTRPDPIATAAAFNPASSLISPGTYVNEFVTNPQPHLLLDVRTAAEYASGHLEDSVNIELNDLPSQLAAIPTDQPVIIYCRSGNRSSHAATSLRQAGYTQVYDLGGIIEWQAAGLPVIR